MDKLDRFKDDSGAVTVDWVVLTAALVIIGGIVVGIIRSGLEDAASAIDETLVTSASALRESSGGSTGAESPADTGAGTDIGPATWDEYLVAAGSEAAAFSAIAENNPEGFYFSGMTDPNGTPIYTNADGGNNPVSYNINGETVLASEYSGGPITQHGPY